MSACTERLTHILTSNTMELIGVMCLLLLASVTRGADPQPCSPRDFGFSSIVCVCNATYCDSLPENEVPLRGLFSVYTSSMKGARFQHSQGQFLDADLSEVSGHTVVHYELNYTSFQTILGWGTAITDSASINLLSLSPDTQEKLLRSYFAEDGIELNLARINIGGCDFSPRPYTYNDLEGDVNLESFALQEEDTKYKIPTIHRTRAMATRPIKIIASPWTAPAWMKTNNALIGYGQLKEEMYQPWANYIAKFLDEYALHNIDVWGLTAQNEPIDGYIPGFFFNCMGWTAEQQRLWVAEYLGPTLESRAHDDVKLMILDDQRPLLPEWARKVLGDPKAAQYVDGIAVHWYVDGADPDLLAQTHEEFPDHFLLSTEACKGMNPLDPHKVKLGAWERAEDYASDIIEDVNHFVTGWVDWNFALDLSGGPNWAENFVDSAIIVDKDKDEFYKNPMFYALGHFSKFVPEGSVRIQMTTTDGGLLQCTAFTTPDGVHVVVALNREDADVELRVSVPGRGVMKSLVVSRSIQTIIFD